jgi:uncharacterized protein YjbJ (UPF0337 family)
MERAEFEGTVRYMAGKLQERFGRLIGDPTHQFEGVARQIEGKLQRSGNSTQRRALCKFER